MKHPHGVELSLEQPADSAIVWRLRQLPPVRLQPEPASMTVPGTDRKIVVLVDQDGASRDSCEQILTDAGFTVLAFPDSLGALDEADSDRRLDLLVTQIQLPAGTPHGLSLAAMIRMRRPHLPVIFLANDHEHARLAGEAADVLIKPIADIALIAAATQLMGESFGR
jgi:CheY-like chemotaxis protein